ncbi:MAG TPA: hypothetical protein VF846_18815 [Thermoanaerobaculia bacterium]|jgi:hypothetical protein
MKKALGILLLLATSAFGQDAPREIFPDDYTPSPCAADADAVCASFSRSRLTQAAGTYRAYHIDDKWLDKHFDELRTWFRPLCAKMGNCFTVKDNDWVYCLDVMRDDFIAVCDRFPEGSVDREQCSMTALIYYIGLGAKTKLHEQAQSCMAMQPPQGERTLVAWVKEKIRPGVRGDLTIHAYDAQSKIPVRARITLDGGTRVKSREGPIPKTGYTNEWTPRLKRVPNAEGHFDVAVPIVTLEATGYKPLQFALPMELSKMIVEISPAVADLKVGKNIITVSARDAVTGAPIEARVMAGSMVVGATNQPLELELTSRDQRPEIWVTSLFDRYSDVVVAPGVK